jgi:hypothetical protein
MHHYSVARGQGYISPHSKTRVKLAALVLCTDAGLIELCVTTQRDVLMKQSQPAEYSIDRRHRPECF